ncbi:hypothetical protein GQ44DRAFT_226812 [Phaeosphaeriaceae sp. PMI808]|nr:hypothetical protein GQ44DRAFT_226812 [Phaeosphaeriaceae sp. PMI808]
MLGPLHSRRLAGSPTPHTRYPKRHPATTAPNMSTNHPHRARFRHDRPINVKLQLPKIVTRRAPLLQPRSDATASRPLSTLLQLEEKKKQAPRQPVCIPCLLTAWETQLAKRKQLCLTSATCSADQRLSESLRESPPLSSSPRGLRIPNGCIRAHLALPANPSTS